MSWSQIRIEGTEVREDPTVNILKDDKEKEVTELTNSFETTNWYFTILGQVDYTILMSCHLWILT